MPAPQVGAVVGGYRFKGGNPNDKSNWEAVASQRGPAIGTEMGGYRFIGGDPNSKKSWTPITAEAVPQAAVAPEEEEGFFSALGRAAERGVPALRKGFAQIIEDYPEIAASIYSTLVPNGIIPGQTVRDLGKIASQSETYKGLTSETVAAERAAAEKRLAEIGPRKYAGVFEEQGLGRKLGSLAETVAESALPVGAGLAAGVATRSPLVAGTVIGAGTAPTTYGGIRERQRAEGIDDVQSAVIGTTVSAALDTLTGVGGKVLTGASAMAARELLEGGLKQAITRTIKSGGEEAVTESLQNVVEQVAGGTDPTTKQAMLETLESGLAGALGGTVFTGASEVVTAPFRGRAAAEPAAIEPTVAPDVRQEFQRLASQEIASIMAADPNMDQNAATSAVSDRAEELLAQATQNVAAATQGGAYEGAGVGTGLDVSRGLEPSVPDVGELGGPAADTGAVGEAVAGRLGEPDLGVPVPDVGEAAQPSALAAAEIAPQPEPKLAFDTTPIYEASALKDRKSAAMQLTSDIAQEVPELQGLPKNKYVQAAGQMAQAAAKGEQFDPVDVLYKVAEIERPAPEVAAPEAVAPEMAAPETAVPQVVPTVFEAPSPDNTTKQSQVGNVIFDQQEGVGQVPMNEDVNYFGFTAMMRPSKFLELAEDLEAPKQKSLDHIRKSIEEGKGIGSPFLNLDFETGKVKSHEGRHRMMVIQEMNGDQPVPVHIFGRGEQRARMLDEGKIAEFGASLTGEGGNPSTDNFSEAFLQGNIVPAAPVAAPAAPAAPTVAMAAPTAPAAPEGGTAPIDNTTVDKAVSAKLTKAQIKKLEEAAGIRRKNLTNMQKRIARSRDAQETMSLAGRLMLMARNPDEDVGLLSSLFNSIPPTVLQKLLGPLLTDDVVRLGEKAGMKAPARIDALMRNEYIPYVNRIMQRAAKLSEKWADYTARSETDALNLADVMFVANMYNADPSLAPTVAEYLKQDPKYQELLAKQATEKDPNKLDTLKRQLGNRRGEIQRLYFGAADPDGKRIAGWNDLPAAGKQIFREARDEYQGTFDEHYRLLMERIDDADLEEEDAGRLKDAVNRMFAEARERVIYFPLKRFGEYWVTVGEGKSGEFHMFETASEQDAFLAQLRKDKDDRTVSSGFGRDSLRKLVGNKDASTALKGVLDMIEDTGVDDVNALKDQIFQMYLTALPESDMRSRFIHRQFKTGFSTDVLRTFASTAVASANQLGRLAYAQKFKNAIDEGYAETEGKPSKRRLDTITRELELRVNGTLSPEDNGGLDWLLSLGAKGTFLFLLSSPKSAIMNLTQLHIVGLPTLSAEFGEKATYGMAARYTGSFLTGQRIANPFRDDEGNVRLQIPRFTLENSAYIQGLKESDPERYAEIEKAWQFQAEHDVTESTFAAATDIYERSNRPTGEYSFTQAARRGDVITAAQRGTANSIEAMGALFHNAERIGREIMFMSAFEMAYERGLKEGKTSEQAGNEARTLAAELTNKGMFDFSNWNKSRYSKHPAGRLPLQMRSYSLAMTSLLFRSFVGMLPLMNKEGKLASARVFFGVGAMTTLYGGFRASQFYVMAMLGYGLYEFLKEMLGGEDEEDKEAEIAGGYLTDETIQREMLRFADEKGRELSKKNMEYYIRSAWIPETFGPGGTMATALGIDDENAQKLSRAADMGIPGVFGVDISNSVSLGDLWHPVDAKAQTPEARFYERIGRTVLGPSGALLFAPFKAVEEANNGNFDKAIEATMPAIIRNFVKAERLKDEGLVVGKNRDVVLKDPSFYDTLTLTMQSLGFTEAETSRAMQMDIKAGDIEKEVSAEQTKLLDRRYRAILDFNKNPTPEKEKAWQKVERDIAIYNLNYPSNEITPEDMEKSLQNKSDEAAERAGGLGYNPKIPVRQTEAERRAAQLYGEQ